MGLLAYLHLPCYSRLMQGRTIPTCRLSMWKPQSSLGAYFCSCSCGTKQGSLFSSGILAPVGSSSQAPTHFQDCYGYTRIRSSETLQHQLIHSLRSYHLDIVAETILFWQGIRSRWYVSHIHKFHLRITQKQGRACLDLAEEPSL